MIFLALLIGISIALQGAVNGNMAGRIGLPTTLFISVSVTYGLVVIYWFMRGGRDFAGTPAAPYYLYTGGILGLIIVSCAATAFPRLGAAATLSFAIAAQLSTAVILDRLGWSGQRVPFSFTRIAGVALLFAGAWLVLRRPQ